MAGEGSVVAGEGTNGSETAAHLRLEPSHLGGWTVATVAGEIDLATAPLLRGYLNDLLSDHGKPTKLIVDLTDVTFCDAYGLGMLNGVHRKARQTGNRLHLVVPEGRVRRLMQIMRRTHELSVYDTVSDARHRRKAPKEDPPVGVTEGRGAFARMLRL